MRDNQEWSTILEEMKKVEPGESCQLDDGKSCKPPEMQQWLTRRIALHKLAYENADQFLGKDTYIWFYKIMKHPKCMSPEEMPPIQRKAVVRACEEDSTWENTVDYLKEIESMDSGTRHATITKMKELLQDMGVIQSDSDLPPGWHRGVQDSQIYYWRMDGTSQWEKPVDERKIIEKLKTKYQKLMDTPCETIDRNKVNKLIEKLSEYEDNQELKDMIDYLTEKVRDCDDQVEQEKQVNTVIDSIQQNTGCDELNDDLFDEIKVVTDQYADYNGYDKIEEEMTKLRERIDTCKNEAQKQEELGIVDARMADIEEWLKAECDKSDDWAALYESYRESLQPYAEKFPEKADTIQSHLDRLKELSETCTKRKEDLLKLNEVLNNMKQWSESKCEQTEDWDTLFQQYKESLNQYATEYPDQKEIIESTLKELETQVTRCTEEKREKQEQEEREAGIGLREGEDLSVQISRNSSNYIRDLYEANDTNLDSMLAYESKCREENEQKKKKAEQEAERKKEQEEQRNKLLEDFEKVKGKPCSEVDSPEVKQYMADVEKADQNIFGSLNKDMKAWIDGCEAENEEKKQLAEEQAQLKCDQEEQRNKLL